MLGRQKYKDNINKLKVMDDLWKTILEKVPELSKLEWCIKSTPNCKL